MYKSVTQENGLGCGLACVAALCKVSYKLTQKNYFKGLGSANTRGYYCKHLIKALSKAGKKYNYGFIKRKINWRNGMIVFIKRSKKYPQGHYLVRLNNKWTDPGINLPHDTNLINAKSGFRRRLPGKAQWLIYEDSKL